MDNTQIMAGYEPRKCSKCGENMKYKGLGEYVCEECRIREFDDYGKVRNYIEKHKGCNAIEVEKETGISRRVVGRLLKEERLEVTKDSKIFLKCERCGKDILSGRFCDKCYGLIKDQREERGETKRSIQGVGRQMSINLEGEMHINRKKD